MSSPVDPEFEMLVIGCTINLLEGLRKTKYKSSIEDDLEYLKMPGLNGRKALAITHRLGQKRILNNNITLLQVLIRILARFKGGTMQEIKECYMARVEDFETEQEVMANRLKLRRYLRELLLNQKRIVQAASSMVEKQKQNELPSLSKPESDF